MTRFSVRSIATALDDARHATHVVGVAATAVWSTPDASGPRDALAVADAPDLDAWAAALDTAARRTLVGRVDTHALLGEPVVVTEERGAWSAVELPLQQSRKADGGYPGWIPTAHLVRRTPVTRPVVIAASPHVATASGALPVGALLDLVRLADEDTVVLRDPSGADHRVPWSEVTDASRPPRSSAEVLAVARGFTGSMYLWAGSSSAGVDCSGLVHVAHRAAGLVVPRDADDQAHVVERLPVGDAADGDLVLYDGPDGIHHVALVDGPSTTLHAPQTGRPVGPGRSDGVGYPDDEVFAGRLLRPDVDR